MISRVVEREVIAVLDHRSLNDFLENPTAEVIACWIWNRIAEHFTRLEEVRLWETATSCAILQRTDMEAGPGPVK